MIGQRAHRRLCVVFFKVTKSRLKNLGDKDKVRGAFVTGDRGLWTPKPSRSCLQSQTFEGGGQNRIQKSVG